jgi:hypothetical protein
MSSALWDRGYRGESLLSDATADLKFEGYWSTGRSTMLSRDNGLAGWLLVVSSGRAFKAPDRRDFWGQLKVKSRREVRSVSAVGRASEWRAEGRWYGCWT